MQSLAPALASSSAGASRLLVQPARRSRGRRPAPPPQAGLFGDLFDYEKWAPRSSQVWRLGVNPADLRQAAEKQEGTIDEEDVEVLNRRMADARQAGGPAAVGAGAAAAAAAAAADEALSASEEEQGGRPSFLQSTDEELASALSDRISQVADRMVQAGAAGGSRGSVDAADGEGGEDAEAEGLLTGPLLRELIYSKWGRQYDVSFVRRDLPLGKTLICLNIMWISLEQRSFPMTEEEYDEKLELTALYLNSWGQADRVASFLRQPARPRKGMPSKPIVGTAISIQLDLDDAIIEEFFSQGGV